MSTTYTRATAERYVNRVYRYIDQFPLRDEDVSGEAEADESLSTEIPESFILKAIDSAIDAIVVRSKACHVYDAVQVDQDTETPSSVIIRLLYGSLKLNGNRATFRTVKKARRLESTSRSGSKDRPVFTYEDDSVTFYPSPDYSGGDTTEIRYVTRPSDITSKSDEMPLDERFEAAIVYYAGSQCFQRLRIKPLQKLARQQFEDEVSLYGIGVKSDRLDSTEVESE